ncbi:LamG-like jellyroll fold domain-containing protein [Actinomyces bowdenii]|uniref:LamG domain-containing protein n=1 Tax=Actinomyces bowdenii TaxID=131109 RepID=A0A853EL53_9ACTO|nr:LamG domain-containing protein [Actinomyces bowdenii]MBF0697402.1 LamG domain-containing protein [Actinomyces bowdenii]NYS69575.1 LamG domain-containing protein [Actinomyces bowdenii]
MRSARPLRGILAAITALPLGLAALTLPVAPAAAEPDAAPAAEQAVAPGAGGEATTVAADGLPTVQINGVVWDQAVVGSTVYAVGQFSTARPAGAAAGQSETPRANALAYDITTGELKDWAPSANGQINAVKASADGSVIYLGGDFTTLNGERAWRVGAVDAADGQSRGLPLASNGSVKALELSADGSTLYLGGAFTQVNRADRKRVAAFDLAGQRLTDFSAQVDDFFVRSIAAAPDGSAVAIGGSFTSVEGSDRPGFGMAILEPSGALRRNSLTSVIRTSGARAGIMELKADDKGLYGVSYAMTGAFEGLFRANWATGDMDYMADCHGDSYALHPAGEVVYVASHAHDCANIGGFPEGAPARYHSAVAYTNAATGTVKPNARRGYESYGGQNGTTNLNFYPELRAGKHTKTNQAAWTVEGNDQYVVYGGEFLAVNGKAQQGLVRFARRDAAPNQQGPMDKGGAYKVSATSPRAGVVTLSFPTNWDRDDKTLTYTVYRDTQRSEPINSQTVTAGYWEPSNLSATDVVEPGSTHRYRVVVTDPWGAFTHSDWVTITAAEGEGLSPYGGRVLADGAAHYWPLDETEGGAASDFVAGRDLTLYGSRYTRGAPSFLDTGSALGLSSDRSEMSNAATVSASRAPSTFSVEAWVRTESTSGGAVVGFGSSASGYSARRDRIVYMRNDGTLSFMLYPGTLSTVTSEKSYNDGQWHHVVATLSPATGATLYVDGKVVAFDSAFTAGDDYTGYWRVGGDLLQGVNGAPSSHFLSGDIDEVAVYGSALGPAQVAQHYTLGSGKEVEPDRDPQDPPAQTTLLADGFDRTVARGWGSAETGGSWGVTWNGDAFSVADSAGRVAMAGPRASSSIRSEVLKSTSTDATLDFSLDAIPGGNGAFISYVARATEAGEYQAKVQVGAAGAPVATISKVVEGRETVLGSILLKEGYTAGQTLHLRMVVAGEASTTLQAKLWTGDGEPEEWGVDVVDSERSLKDPGWVRINTYMSSLAGPETVTLSIEGIKVSQL